MVKYCKLISIETLETHFDIDETILDVVEATSFNQEVNLTGTPVISNFFWVPSVDTSDRAGMVSNATFTIKSDVFLRTESVNYTIDMNTTFDFSPDLSCSTGNMTTVEYEIAPLSGETLLDWVDFDVLTGAISGTTPEVTSNTTYSFYILSNYEGASKYKLVTILVIYTGIDPPIDPPPVDPIPTDPPVSPGDQTDPVVEDNSSKTTTTSADKIKH